MKKQIIYASFIIMMSITGKLLAQTIPSDLMRNCKGWKITYPTGVEDKTLCGEANNEFFYINDTKDAIVFKAPVRSDNGTTPNSSYIRSELRERTEDGTADIYWTTTGRHFLYVKQAITHLPLVKPHVVGTQIHGNKADGIDDAMVLRLEGSHLFLSFNGTKLRSDVTIKTDYVLGKKHEIIFEVVNGKHYCYYSEDGNLLTAYKNGNASAYYVKASGSEVLMTLDYDQSYFKVGNYTQTNPDTEGSKTNDVNNYGEVAVYDFVVEHGTVTTSPIAVNGVTLASTLSISKGSTAQLIPTISPSDATNKAVTYSSSNPSVATVNANGLVSAVNNGSTTITVTTTDGSFKVTSNVTVQDAPRGLTNIALNKTVSASGTPEAANPAQALVDGSTSTRLSVMGMPQTIIIDLGENFDISYSELVFHDNRAYKYTISTATTLNGSYTEKVDRLSNTTSGTITSPITDYFTATGRFVKLTVTGASNYTGEWVSILEFRVFGEKTLVTSINEANETQLSVYPNPVENVLNYSIGTLEGAEKIEIFDITGVLVMTENILEQNGQIDLSNLKKGVYVIKIEAQTSYTKRFSKN